MTPYAGNDANFPTTVSQPDNSDLINPAAGTLNVPSQGTLDRTAYLHKRLAAAPACSWEPQVAMVSSCDNAAWSSKGGYWWACGGGNADLIKATPDYGKSWSSVVPGALGLLVYSLDFDLAGNACVVSTGGAAAQRIYSYTFATATWSVSGAGFGLIGTVNKARVRFESTNSVWACFYNDTTAVTGAMRVSTSLDRVTWTDRTASLPSAFVVVTTQTPHIGVGGGNIVAAFKSSATTVNVARAVASAPTVWVGATITTTTITAITDCSDPAYSNEDATWQLAICGTTAGNNVTEFYKSTDGGQTWTLSATIATSGLRVGYLANLGHLFAGLSLDGFIVYSLDLGTTWFPAGMKCATPGATNVSLWSGGGGLLVVDYGVGANSRTSAIRLSNLGAVALT